jgi:hypothetical protein
MTRFRRLLVLGATFFHLDAPAPGNEEPPPFTLRETDGRWSLVTPEGQPFFSTGVCLVTQGTPRGEYDPENPSYAAWHHYPDARAWADAAARRLRDWGFTTIGAWSDFRALRESPEAKFHFAPVLHIGSTAGVPWWDMWDDKIIARMEELAQREIPPLAVDSRLMGWFTDNEMGWWNATMWKMTLEQPPSSGQRQRLLRLLRETYATDWEKLTNDFEPELAGDFSELEQRGLLYLRPGGDGIRVMRQFLGLMAERYYQLTKDIIRRHDKRGLIMGDRYQSFYYPEVARACGRHVDVVSTNLNAAWNDGSSPPFYLETLHALTKKPLLVSELYMAATENRSRNRNSSGTFPVVATQAERADGYRRTMTDLLRLPFVVGADWFQYFDEPMHGRGDGENYNFGLVDIHDEPYAELTAAVKSAGASPQRARALPCPPDSPQRGVPCAPDEPFASFTPGLALKHWDRGQGRVPPASEFPVAELYLCWNPQALYLGLWALDFAEDVYYASKQVPKADRALWTVQAGGAAEIRARIGAGREPLINDPDLRIENLSGVNLTVRNIAILEIPARKLGRSEFKAGEAVELSSTSGRGNSRSGRKRIEARWGEAAAEP